MKPFVRVCLIIAVIAAVLGLVGIGAGVAMGASPEEFLNLSLNETHRVLKPGNDDFVEVFGVVSSGAESEISVDENAVVVSPETASVAGGNAGLVFGDKNTQSLELELKAGEIQFYLYEGDSIIFSAEDLNEISRYFLVEVDGQKLSIEDTRKHVTGDLQLQVYLPDRTFRDIDLDLGAADAYIEALQADEISVDLGAGNLEADRIAAGRSADLDVGAGAMVIACLEGKELDLDCGIGSLSIVLQGRESDYTYTLDCGAGTIQVGGSGYSGLWHETRTDTSARTDVEKHVDIDCGIGEISIAFEEE